VARGSTRGRQARGEDRREAAAPLVRGERSAPERVLDLQRHAGNAAVTQLVVQRKAVAHTPAAKVPGLLAAEPLLAPYVGKGGGKALKVKVLKRPDLAKAYIAYAIKQGIPAEEARAKAPITAAFTDLDTGQIYLDRDRGDPGTIVHEGLHLRSSREFVQGVHQKINEGTTELFTRKVCAQAKIERTQDDYVNWMLAVEKLVTKSSIEALALAYFRNDTSKLQDDLEQVRPGLWTDWQREIIKSASGSIAFLDKLGS
jgi:hypothetical protein